MHKEKIKLGYKLIRLRDGKLLSWRRYGQDGETEYKIGEWVKPNRFYGSFAVFNTYEDALDAECYNSVFLRPFYHRRNSKDYDVLYVCAYVDGIEGLHTPKDVVNPERLPKGTRYAKRVMLIEKVKVGANDCTS